MAFSSQPIESSVLLACRGRVVRALETVAVGVPSPSPTHTMCVSSTVDSLVTMHLRRSRHRSQGRRAQARELEMKVHPRSRSRRDRVNALRTLATLEPSPCTRASRGMPLHTSSSCAQDDLSALEVSVTIHEASDIAELERDLRRYERGHAMALQVRVSLCTLIERGLACLSRGYVWLE